MSAGPGSSSGCSRSPIPTGGPLLLVEVAGLLGAEKIEFELGPNRATVTLDSATLSRRDLDGLSTWATGERRDGDRRLLARRQLALAYLALRARAVERIEIIVAPEDELATRLRYAAKQERLETLDPGEQHVGVRLHVDFESRDPRRAQRERALLEARCSCSRLPIYVDGEAIAKDWSWIFGDPKRATPARLAAHVEVPVVLDGEVIGVAGLHLSARLRGGFARFVVNGVQIEDVRRPGQAGFRAVVEVDLRRDLSQAKLLRDEHFAAVLAAVDAARAKLRSDHALARREPTELTPSVKARRLRLAFGLGVGTLLGIAGLAFQSILFMIGAVLLLLYAKVNWSAL